MPTTTRAAQDTVSYPRDWSERRLEQVAQINPESLGADTPPGFRFRYIDISSVNRGTIDWHSVATHLFATAPSRARRIVRPNDVLLSTVRPGLQSHAYADWQQGDGYVCSTGFAVLRAGADMEPRLLRHLVFSRIVARQLHRLETGSNYPAVPGTDVESVLVPVPPPPEQRRIAEILDTADEAIRQSERVIAKLKAVKAGLLHDLLTRGLDEHGRLRDPLAHPEQFKDSPLGRIPASWAISCIADLAAPISNAIVDGPFGSNLKVSDYVEAGVPVLQGGDITGDAFQLGELRFVSPAKARELERSLVRVGDLLVVKIGSVGYSAIIDNLDPFAEALIPANLLKATFDPSKVLTEYVHCYLTSEAGRRRLIDAASQTAQPALTLGRFRALQISVPTVQEQARIVMCVGAYDSRIRAEEAALAKLRQVKRGLMDDLLTGKTRVNT